MRWIAISLLFLAGCSIGVTPTNVQYPHIERATRPTLYVVAQKDLEPLSPDIRAKLIENNSLLKAYIEKLEAGIDTYNEWAKEHSK